jgi:hypothetical protein
MGASTCAAGCEDFATNRLTEVTDTAVPAGTRTGAADAAGRIRHDAAQRLLDPLAFCAVLGQAREALRSINNPSSSGSSKPDQGRPPRRHFMYSISASFEVNAPGDKVAITREQMWKGLVQKAEYAVPFVPAMEDCRVLERYDDGFLREISLRGTVMRERIVFTPDVEVYFERVDPADGGWITNVISESVHGLLLTFTFALTFPGVAAGSAEEMRLGDKVKASYVEAISATILETRRRVSEGVI